MNKINELFQDNFIVNTSYEILINDNNFDIISEYFEKLLFGYYSLLLRSKKLSKCKRRIFQTKLFLWRIQFERCLRYIWNNINIQLYDITDIVKEYLIQNKLANSKFIDFYTTFHKNLSIPYINFLNNIIKQDLSIKEKIKILIEEFLELMNISLLELEGMKFSCKVLKGECSYCTNCNECENEDNIMIWYLVPEYFKFAGVMDSIIDSFQMFNSPNEILLIINYEIICKRMNKYYWEEQNAFCRYNKIKKYINNIYFIKYNCVNFGKYEKKLKEQQALITSKQHFKELIKSWKNQINK